RDLAVKGRSGWSEKRHRQIENAVTVEVRDRDSQWLVMQQNRGGRTKSSVAIPKRHIGRPLTISYHQVSVPIPIKVSTGYLRREWSHHKSVRRTETAVAVSQENAHGPVGAGDVRDSVVVEILDHSS